MSCAQFFTNIDCLKASVRALGTWSTDALHKGDQVLVKRGSPEIYLTVVGRKWVDGRLQVELHAPANHIFNTVPEIENLVESNNGRM